MRDLLNIESSSEGGYSRIFNNRFSKPRPVMGNPTLEELRIRTDFCDRNLRALINTQFPYIKYFNFTASTSRDVCTRYYHISFTLKSSAPRSLNLKPFCVPCFPDKFLANQELQYLRILKLRKIKREADKPDND